MNQQKIDYSLYLVTDQHIVGERNLYDCLELAIQGGVTIVQLREKHCTSSQFYQVAIRIKEITDRYQVPLIINDRVDIALAVDAAGVHLGQEDLPIKAARNVIGQKIIGVSARTVEQALLAQEQGANYLGVGAVFPTQTKTNTVAVSMEELQRIKECVKIPVIAIGGINIQNVPDVARTNVDGVAVVSGILGEKDILVAAKQIRQVVGTRD